MFCWNCGKRNPEDHKYCGACGKLLSTPREDDIHEAVVLTAAREALAERTATANPLIAEPGAVHEKIVPRASLADADLISLPPSATHHRISGPSFLGLSGDTDGSDYLIEEEEQRSSWRGWLTLIIFLVIALLVWKQWSVIKDSARVYGERAGILRPAQTQAPPTTAPEVANPPAAVSEGNITVNDDAAAPEAKNNAAPPEDPSLPPKETTAPKPSAQDDDGNIPPKSEPAPVPSTAAQDAQVELAQRYLHGRGVVQDCARGMSLLRSAASKASTKARIQLGALYATGHCVTQDRATAYRWFAQAQELEPENSYVNRNMNSLWTVMTTAERRRAEAQ
jgi:hypothetical protein